MAIEKTIKLKVDSGKSLQDVKKLDDGVKGISTNSKGATAGLGGMTGMTQKLGLAFKALGIGLIISALMKLKDIFSGNIETARQFERIAARVGAAFDVLRDRTESFIKALIDLKNPFKAFKEAFTGTTDEIRKEQKAIDEFTKSLQNVRDQERELVVERAKANRVIAESRLLAEDETKTLKERLSALKNAIKVENEISQKELATQQQKVDNLQAIIDLGKSSEQDLIDLENERARLIDLQTASLLRQKRVKTEVNTFEREIAAERKKEGETIITLEKKTLQQSELNLNKEMELNKKRVDDAKNTAENLVKIEKLTQDQKAAIVSGALSQISGALGENSKAGKSLAIAQALIDTYTGANKALAQGGIFGAISAAGIVAAGLANVARIKSTNPETGSGGGGGGGVDTNVPTPTGLGGAGLIPNLENINQNDLGTPEPVQAFVVENDISNAQALQEELEIQATL